VNTHHVSKYTIYTNTKFSLKASVFADWQAAAYAKLQQGYDAMLSAYNAALADEEAAAATQESEVEETQTNPAFNRITEQRELKRACIEMLTQPFCRKIGQNLFETETCDCPDKENQQSFPHIKQDQKLVDYTEQARFLEQVFEWHIMSYTFHPYYYADRCRWAELMQLQNDDTLFQGFLQSGLARVTLTVRPEYTEAVLYYLQTGDIKMLTGDALLEAYQAMFKDLLTTANGNPKPIKEWETRVPSTLTMIQSGTTGLKANGLPCCHDPESTVGVFYADQAATLHLKTAENDGK
jgi:hypothetical protein